jgi:hypothetical protein
MSTALWHFRKESAQYPWLHGRPGRMGGLKDDFRTFLVSECKTPARFEDVRELVVRIQM